MQKGIYERLIELDMAHLDVKGKTVLIRSELNVAFDGGIVTDETRVKESAESISALMLRGAKVVVISHLTKSEKSLEPIAPILQKYLGNKPVQFCKTITDSSAKAMIKGLLPGQCLLLENLRTDPREIKGDGEFARELMMGCDYFVQDSYGTLHRDHASITTIVKMLPVEKIGVGISLLKEARNYDKLSTAPATPIGIVIGGKKPETKIECLPALLDLPDVYLIMTGWVGAIVAQYAGVINYGPSLEHSIAPQKLERVKKALLELKEKTNNFTSPRLFLPNDHMVRKGVCAENNEEIYDIGEGYLEKIKQILSLCRIIELFGPPGYAEKFYNVGTEQLLLFVAELSEKKSTTVIIGGGESNALVAKYGIPVNRFVHISTAGGAGVMRIAHGILKGEEVLINKQSNWKGRRE